MNKEVIEKFMKGGISGFTAMGCQVITMMWLRTTINYQYRNGGNFKNTVKKLYNEGGIPRFYRGLSFAIFQAPLSRFGDTAMNVSMMHFLKDTNMNIAEKTFLGSCGAGLWRISILPIDTYKSNLQVNGKEGLSILKNKIKKNGYKTLYNGSLASGMSTLVSHFPWFYSYNYLNSYFPKDNFSGNEKIFRSAFVGFTCSSISDIFSNSLRVIKINKQTDSTLNSYQDLIKNIVEKDRVFGLFTRGLKTKLMLNGLQGMIFTVIFDFFMEK